MLRPRPKWPRNRAQTADERWRVLACEVVHKPAASFGASQSSQSAYRESLVMGSRALTICKILLILAIMAMLVSHSPLIGSLQLP